MRLGRFGFWRRIGRCRFFRPGRGFQTSSQVRLIVFFRVGLYPYVCRCICMRAQGLCAHACSCMQMHGHACRAHAYMHMRAYAYIHRYTYTYAHMHPSVRAWMCVDVHAFARLCMHMMRMHMRARACLCMHAICTHVHAYACICIYMTSVATEEDVCSTEDVSACWVPPVNLTVQVDTGS
jgi:hypothetical protein